MKTLNLNDLSFMGVYGYAPLNGEQVNRRLSPRMARERAVRALKHAAKCASGTPVWLYDADQKIFILTNPASPCFSLALSAEALGFAGEVLTNDRFQFDF